MRIKIKGYLTLKEVIGDQPPREIRTNGTTVKDLIEQLSRELGGDFARVTSSAGGDGENRHVLVLLNGRHCSHLPDGLDTELKDGDEVAIFPPVAGG